MCRPEIDSLAEGTDRDGEYRKGRVVGHSQINERIFFIRQIGGARVWRMMDGQALKIQPLDHPHEAFEPECSEHMDAIATLNRRCLRIVK